MAVINVQKTANSQSEQIRCVFHSIQGINWVHVQNLQYNVLPGGRYFVRIENIIPFLDIRSPVCKTVKEYYLPNRPMAK